jgi:hypothetical protein
MESFNDFLTNSPYFIKKNSYSESQEYFFEHNLSIQIEKQFDIYQIEPICWDGHYNGGIELYETPEWFLQLYKQVFEAYYQKNRLRYKFNDHKLPIGNLIEAYCLAKKEHSFYQRFKFFQNEKSQQVVFIKEEYEEKLTEIIQYLQSFDYVVIDKKRRNKKIYYYIN